MVEVADFVASATQSDDGHSKQVHIFHGAVLTSGFLSDCRTRGDTGVQCTPDDAASQTIAETLGAWTMRAAAAVLDV